VGPRQGHAFQDGSGVRPTPGADGWQLSNPPILGAGAAARVARPVRPRHDAALRTKSEALTGYLEQLIDADLARRAAGGHPARQPAQRGCQLSIRVIGGRERGRDLFEFLASRGVLGDWREPDVIRISPVPLYNTHADVLRFANTVREWRDDR
jgi:kynureninase